MKISYIFTLLVVTRLYTIAALPHKRQVAYELPLTSINGDKGYIFPISFGRQIFNVLLDTGSTDLWVSDISCSNCGNKRKYNPKRDGSFRTNHKSFEIRYGKGSVEGYIGSADLSINGALIPQQIFGLATKMDYFQDKLFDGIMGFNFEFPTPLGGQSAFMYMVDNGMIPNPRFGVYLGRESEGTGNAGRLHIGDIDRTRFISPISFNRVDDNEPDWKISLQSIMVNGHTYPTFRQLLCLIDTGASILKIPYSDVDSIANLIPGSAVNKRHKLFVPCDSTPSFIITFGSVSYTIPPRDIIGNRYNDELCHTNIIGRPERRCTIGTPFLKNVYSVFETTPSGNYVGFGFLTPAFSNKTL
ncbi:16688_t:CDS:1 [Acaulospora morrowiae]|uniref:16688_t:CDS:1 n=1 Tax=Acaulospora morrowiae TaxID=94023 RepID=A0A9N9BRL0_9GLOM|nr:16688_t:CDS:1 [Acaulospora morrowiae]